MPGSKKNPSLYCSKLLIWRCIHISIDVHICNESDMVKRIYDSAAIRWWVKLATEKKQFIVLWYLHWEKEEHRLRMGVLKINPDL